MRIFPYVRPTRENVRAFLAYFAGTHLEPIGRLRVRLALVLGRTHISSGGYHQTFGINSGFLDDLSDFQIDWLLALPPGQLRAWIIAKAKLLPEPTPNAILSPYRAPTRKFTQHFRSLFLANDDITKLRIRLCLVLGANFMDRYWREGFYKQASVLDQFDRAEIQRLLSLPAGQLRQWAVAFIRLQ